MMNDEGLTCIGIDHDAAFVDRLADFVLGTALVFARIGGTVEGAHNQLGTSSARGRKTDTNKKLEILSLDRLIYRWYATYLWCLNW